MNLNQILNMLLRQFMNKAMKTGIDYAARRGKDPARMTPEEREQARKAQGLAQKARKMTRLGRRL